MSTNFRLEEIANRLNWIAKTNKYIPSQVIADANFLIHLVTNYEIKEKNDNRSNSKT